LLIGGQRLSGEATRVRIAGNDVAPLELTDTQIKVSLATLPPAALLAGVQGLQVIQPAMLGAPPAPHVGAESNVAAIVLRPQIQKDPQAQEYLITKSSMTGSGDGPYEGEVTLQVAPAIGRAQRVVLLLNQTQAPTGVVPAYSFNAPPRDPKTAPPADVSISVPIQGVARGSYLVRVQVDGAESPLDFVAGQYSGPLLTVP
jgi:hypothetical protein